MNGSTNKWRKALADRVPGLAYVWPTLAVPVVSMAGFLEQNADELVLREILLPLEIGLACSVIVLLAVHLFVPRNPERAGFISYLLVATFFGYGLLYDLTQEKAAHFGTFTLGPNKYLMVGIAVLLVVVIARLTNPDLIRQLMRVVRVAVLVLLVSSSTLTARALLTAAPPAVANERMPVIPQGRNGGVPANEQPDIFIVVLDSYMGSDSLDMLGYDNRGFIEDLGESGFRVVPHATSNYGHTFLSLASALNLDYVGDLPGSADYESENARTRFLRQLIQNPAIVKVLKDRGYEYVLFASGWPATDRSPLADVLHPMHANEQLLAAAARTTMLKPFVDTLEAENKRVSIPRSFAALAEEARDHRKKPRLVLAHLMMPHPPFTFGPNGERSEFSGEFDFEDPALTNAYMGQLAYTNTLLREILPDLTSETGRPRIVLLTGDHGYWLRPKDIDNSSESITERNFGIMSAYYFSDGEVRGIYPGMTLVNGMRAIVNTALGSDLGPLVDRNLSESAGEPDGFKDLTAVVTGLRD